MKRAAVYYRVSTDKQDLDSQKHAVEAWLSSLKPEERFHAVQVFQDEAVSGRVELGRRPGGKALLKAVAQGSVDTVLVFKLDRLSRTATKAIRYLQDFDEAGVAFVSATEPQLNLAHTNPMRHVMIAMMACIAQIERDSIVTRVRAGMAAAKARGAKFGAPRKVTADIQAIARRLKDEGASIRTIASHLSLSSGAIHKAIRGPDL